MILNRNKFRKGLIVSGKDRVVMSPLEEEIESCLVMPQNTSKDFFVSVVESHDNIPGLEYGDIVLYQMVSGYMSDASKSHINGKPVLILNKGDIIAKLISPKVEMSGFTILGNWVLLNPVYENSSNIEIPDAHKQDKDYKFFVLQMGQGCNEPKFKVGDRVIPSKTRITGISIENKNYVFLDCSSVLAVVGS